MKLRKQSNHAHARCAATLVAVAILLVMSGTNALASGPLEKPIYSFQGGSDGQNPYAGLIADKDGNLYGTTAYGGSSTCIAGCGTVFELSPPVTPGGAWTKTQLYAFQGSADGADPLGPVVLDKAGNLYGTTNAGDSITTNGTVFELSPPATAGGTWAQTTLYAFPADGSHGMYPAGNLAVDAEGNLYGTTRAGGGGCCAIGTVFKVAPPAASGGQWMAAVIYTFYYPYSPYSPWSGVFLHGGVLYGTSTYGGTGLNGAVYQLTRVNGQWNESTVYSFGSDIGQPLGGVAFDGAGNIYGTAWDTGRPGCDYQATCGGIFELLAPATSGGTWTKKVLHYFAPGEGGSNPRGSLLVDGTGKLYGTASAGGLVSKGQHTGNGTVFELIPPNAGASQWTETTLHNFSGSAYGDGSNPDSNLISVKGKLFGTTYAGGANGYGSVFSLTVEP